MVKVLFVCTGNICRSPMAEGVFQHLVDQAGLSNQIVVDSAGTSAYHVGEHTHSGTRAVLQKHGISYTGRSRRVIRRDFEEFDYILGMDHYNMSSLRSMQPTGTNPVVKPFLAYADGITDMDVPDPYYEGNFEEVYRLVEAASTGLLQAIRSEHNL